MYTKDNYNVLVKNFPKVTVQYCNYIKLSFQNKTFTLLSTQSFDCMVISSKFMNHIFEVPYFLNMPFQSKIFVYLITHHKLILRKNYLTMAIVFCKSFLSYFPQTVTSLKFKRSKQIHWSVINIRVIDLR